MDSDKKSKVLDAALQVFLRYGFKKATMGDIAEKAGISRPAVYLVFPGKEEIFRAVIVRKVEDFCRESEKKLARCTGLKAGITAILDTWIFEPYETLTASPEAAELMEFAYSFAPDLRRQSLQLMEEQLLQVMTSAPETQLTPVGELGVSAKMSARLLAVSTVELKHSVENIEELRQLLDAAVAIHVSCLTAHSNAKE